MPASPSTCVIALRHAAVLVNPGSNDTKPVPSSSSIARKSSARSTRRRSRADSCDRCGYRSACHRGVVNNNELEIPARCGPAGSFPQPCRLEALVVVIGLLGLRLVARYEHRARRAAGDPFADAGERALSGQLPAADDHERGVCQLRPLDDRRVRPTMRSRSWVPSGGLRATNTGTAAHWVSTEAWVRRAPARVAVMVAPHDEQAVGTRSTNQLFVLWSLGCELKRRGDSVLAGDHPSTLERLAPLFDPCFRAGDPRDGVRTP